jgi:methionyl-tRNA formyltransferase
MKIAIFGQAPFGKDVTEGLAAAGHEIVGVYTPPEGRRPDPLAELASERGWRLLRHKRFRRKGEAIPELVDEYLGLGAELNVMPFTTVILPPEIVDAPPHGSLCFHPSKLPAHRGGSAIAWQIILGTKETAATVFQPDAGVDTGPIVVQRAGIAIEPHHTAASLYFDALYGPGVEAMLEAVAGVADGSAVFAPQSEVGASHEPLLGEDHARIDWSAPAEVVDRLVRGCDPNPGAWGELGGEKVRFYGARLELGESRTGADAGAAPGTLVGVEDGSLRIALRGGSLLVKKVRIGSGAKLPASEAPSELAPGTRLDQSSD